MLMLYPGRLQSVTGFLVGFARVLVTCGCPLSISRGPNPLASRLRGAAESCAIYMADP